MSEGRRSQVVLLDERRLDIVIQSRLYGGELLDIVASHFNLKEKEYFGISYVDEHGQHSWLYLDKRVLEHDFPKKSTSQGQVTTLVLYFRIKYYVESITLLRDSATIEAFYLQTKSLISKGDLEIDSDIIFQLAALVIQATYGDYTDDQIFRSHLKRLPVLPTFTLKEFPSISACEKQVLDHYKVLVGQTRGAAIVNYLSIVESLPTYGQHYYEVKDKGGNPCWLSLSYRGISQYDKSDRRNPRRVFLWKQLENLYFRDRKFTIEVHEARRVVHTLSSFNLYEDAIEEPVEEFDDLSNAICDPTTQVSVSRRALAPASVTVYVWYAASSNVAKCIWSMAIAQHQFFLDRNQKKPVNHVGRSLSQIASELCKSVQSLSSASSHSNISRSTSTASLPTIIIEGELSEESKAATIEMLSALQARKDALQDALKKKTEELKTLCLQEGEITGELPPETPFQPGEAQPQVRRRIGTSFTISDKIIYKAKGQDRETLNNLELDYEIQSKIASAAYKLATDVTARKSVRKLRKVSYQQATSKLKDIEEKLSTLKREKESHKKIEGTSNDNGSHFLGLPTSSSENSIDKTNLASTLACSSVPPSTSLPQLTEGACLSAPPSPSKSRHRHQSLQHVPIITDDVYEDVIVPFNLRTSRRNSSSYSATSEYDAVSCGGSSIASLGIPYRNRFEVNLDIEGTNHYSVPNRRASQAFNDQEDLLSDDKSEDALSRCFIDGTQQNRYLTTPLPCSYDERLSYAKTGGFPLQASESNYDKTSIDSNGIVNLSCGDSAYHASESTKADTFSSHSYSENTLHRTQSGPLHYKLSQMHISDSALNLEDLNNANGIRHVYSVPTLPRSATLRPVNTFANPSASDCLGVSNQTINQVADLVQASVLLQDCKRAASASSLEFCSPKIKTKEWIETSLDSPIVSKKKKQSVESFSKTDISQPAEWYENGLPAAPSPTDSFYNFQTPQSYYNDHILSKIVPESKQLASSSVPCSSPDYQNIGPDGMFPMPTVYERSHSSRSLYSESNQYHHYENIDDLPTGKPFPKAEGASHYENVIPSSDSSKRDETEEKSFKHYLNHEDYCDSSNISVAQPQEPPKRPIRRINVGSCFPTDDILEVEAHSFLNSTSEEADFSCGTSYAHCDIPEAPSQYSQPHFESRNTQEPEPILNDPAPQHIQNWQQYPSSPPAVDNGPVSPTSFSPSVEVNVVSVGHFQPYWEETKPYEISDFYKYSTKHRRQQKPQHAGSTNENLGEVNGKELVDPTPNHIYNANKNARVGTNQEYSHSSCSVPRSHALNAPNQHQELVTNSVPVFDTSSFLESPAKYYEGTPSPVVLRHPENPDKSLSLGEVELRISLADTFHDEMVAWYQNQDSVKRATLV